MPRFRAPRGSRPKSPRNGLGDLDGVVWFHERWLQAVQLWREDGARTWVYLGRLAPGDAHLDSIQTRFGGGWFKAKLFGRWRSGQRREAFLEQISFGIEGPPTDVTLTAIARAAARR